ncbi:alpha-1,3-mannosyl-glycoprotein 4-beta-N-acetylglucosaminyltransferase A-like isoform X1 [Ostrinia nubilalis]|uniref:alpha-1,3-mannosyl-glycoprotein 4-beta-N-acetylglucosaminyltransferase A-like isoform X1 n=2 Tax=Ostrinia nubilalis TaxID=29057 RepID=UPI0030824336
MHYVGDRYLFMHSSLRKRLLLSLFFCIGLFSILFFKTVQVLESREEINRIQFLYESCQEKLKTVKDDRKLPPPSNQLEQFLKLQKPLPANVLQQLNKMNGSIAATGFKNLEPLPSTNFILPHLQANIDGLKPAYYVNRKMPGTLVDIVIGLTTAKREKGYYLNNTLQDLVNGVVDDITTILIIVMIAETDLKFVLDTAWAIEKQFPSEVQCGMIQIIAPSSSYYPDMKSIPPTLGDSKQRTRWRAKQVLDRVFIMAYGLNKGSFYLMMEDDVVARKTYVKGVKSYISFCTKNHPDWLVIEFSHYFGSLGKLFRSTDVGHFIIYLQLFYYNMPLDFLLENYLEDKACGRLKNTESCFISVNKIRLKYPVSLFLHVGLYSSLPGKIMKVEEASAFAGSAFFPHKNPPLKRVYCDILEVPFHTAKMAYNGEYLFLGVNPKPGDTIEYWFAKPTVLKSFVFQSGNYQNTKDLLKKADVEVLPLGGLMYNFTKVGSFDEFGYVKGDLARFGPLEAIRLKVIDYGPTDTGRVVISEIMLVPLDDKDFV